MDLKYKRDSFIIDRLINHGFAIVLSATLFTSSPVKGFCTQQKKSLALTRSVMMDLISIRWISEVINICFFFACVSQKLT